MSKIYTTLLIASCFLPAIANSSPLEGLKCIDFLDPNTSSLEGINLTEDSAIKVEEIREIKRIVLSAVGFFSIVTLGGIFSLIVSNGRRTRMVNSIIIKCLGNAAEFKDNETGMHVTRVSHYAKIVAKSYGCSDRWCEDLFLCAPMHDIGKIAIPDKILHKSGKLSKEEWEVMKMHPIHGYKIIGEHDGDLLKMARDVSAYHHERWDGSGYPYCMKGEEIPLSARIIAIADVYDALTSVRPYKQAWSTERAKELIELESGKHFDPMVVDAFVSCFDEILEARVKYTEPHLLENNQIESAYM